MPIASSTCPIRAPSWHSPGDGDSDDFVEYLTVSQARGLPGLRLVLSAHVPGPWGEAAKAVFAARGVAYAPVAQEVFGANEDLYAWTGHRNAPVAMLDDEPPVTGWLDLLMLAERLGQGPSLLPQRSDDRVVAVGLSAEICAPHGFGWERRLLMLGARFDAEEPPAETPASVVAACRRYGYAAATLTAAATRMADIMTTLAAQLARQRAAGSPYLVGDRLSAADLYWACFSNMVAPLPPEDAPMPAAIRDGYGTLDPVVAAALDPALLRHRDFVYARHIGLPLVF